MIVSLLTWGDMCRYGCPQKSPDWDGDVESWTESEGTSSSSEQCEHYVESLAPKAIGQDQSGELISLFLEDWELARVVLSCHMAPGLVCARTCMHEAWQLGCWRRDSPKSPEWISSCSASEISLDCEVYAACSGLSFHGVWEQ